MVIIDQIDQLVRPIVEERGCYLVDLVLRGGKHARVLEVFIDTDAGVTTGLCADISRELSRALDDTGPIMERYQLVVSSPGTDRPLKWPRQYPRNVGRTLAVKFRDDTHVVKFEGKLIGADMSSVTLRTGDGEDRRLDFDSIIEAYVKTAW